MALEDNGIPEDEVAAAFHKNRPPFSGLMFRVKPEDDQLTHDIDKTPDGGI
jgi:hypothetical protein